MEIPKIQPKIPNLADDVEIQQPQQSDAEPVGFANNDSARPSSANNFDDVLTGAKSGNEFAGTQDLTQHRDLLAASEKFQQILDQHSDDTFGPQTATNASTGSSNSINQSQIDGLKNLLSVSGGGRPEGAAGIQQQLGIGSSGPQSLQELTSALSKLPMDNLRGLATALGVDIPGQSTSDFGNLVHSSVFAQTGPKTGRDVAGYGSSMFADDAAPDTSPDEPAVDDTEAQTQEGDPIDTEEDEAVDDAAEEGDPVEETQGEEAEEVEDPTEEDSIIVEPGIEIGIIAWGVAKAVAAAITVVAPEAAPVTVPILLGGDDIPPGDSDMPSHNRFSGRLGAFHEQQLQGLHYGGSTDSGNVDPASEDTSGVTTGGNLRPVDGVKDNVGTQYGDFGLGGGGDIQFKAPGNVDPSQDDDNTAATIGADSNQAVDTLNSQTLKPSAGTSQTSTTSGTSQKGDTTK